MILQGYDGGDVDDAECFGDGDVTSISAADKTKPRLREESLINEVPDEASLHARQLRVAEVSPVTRQAAARVAHR